jgi:hypothetical protein
MTIELSDYELGWLVGILEGEAYFGFQSYTQQLKIKMTDYDTMNTVALLLGKITGKCIEVRTQSEIRENCQEVFGINISGETVRTIMRTIVPYMHGRRRAKIWQALNGYSAPRQKTFKELGIDVKSLLGSKEEL